MLAVLIEAAAVGAVLAPFLLLAMVLVKPTSAISILLIGFVLGFLFHLLCELLRVNRWYCTHGHACKT